MLRAGLQTALRMIYPPQCLGCGGLVAQDNGICAACFAETPFITGLVCDLCGIALPGQSDIAVHCDDCLSLGRPWTRGRAPLRYEGVARRLVLGLKHGDRHEIVDMAADWMVAACPPDMPKDTTTSPRCWLKRLQNGWSLNSTQMYCCAPDARHRLMASRAMRVLRKFLMQSRSTRNTRKACRDARSCLLMM
jgi:predicted amidophosphoribosyltransferase